MYIVMKICCASTQEPVAVAVSVAAPPDPANQQRLRGWQDTDRTASVLINHEQSNHTTACAPIQNG